MDHHRHSPHCRRIALRHRRILSGTISDLRERLFDRCTITDDTVLADGVVPKQNYPLTNLSHLCGIWLRMFRGAIPVFWTTHLRKHL